MLRHSALLAVLVTLAACTATEPETTPTRVVETPTVAGKAGSKIITDLSQLETTPTPATATPTISIPTETPQPIARLSILSYRSYTDSIGSLWVVGEAENAGETTASEVEVAMILLDDANKTLATTYATVYLPNVPIGTKMPFRGMFAQPPANWKTLKVDLTTSPLDPLATSYFVSNLKVTNSTIKPGVGVAGTTIAGEVKNEAKEPAVSVRIIGVLHGDDGKVTDVVDGYTRLNELAPGESSTFGMQFFSAQQAGKYDLYVLGRTKPIVVLPTVIASDAATPTPAGTSTPISVKPAVAPSSMVTVTPAVTPAESTPQPTPTKS